MLYLIYIVTTPRFDVLFLEQNVMALIFLRLYFPFLRVSFMNNQKQQKPTLSGQRFKTRKRGKYVLKSLSKLPEQL